MLCLGLIIHTDVFRLQENPGEIRQGYYSQSRKQGRGPSTGTCRHRANMQRGSSHRIGSFLPEGKKKRKKAPFCYKRVTKFSR